ncbi:MAG TPA: lysophospholipid acyltransferase family protein, partial [Pirellulaceae bacterium]|nr:lysophospholipid acyltransferase family protein [Pirellulaceae bacterium]
RSAKGHAFAERKPTFTRRGARLSISPVAVVFFLLLVVVPLVALVVVVARSRLSPIQCFLWAVAYLLCKFLWRARWLNEPTLAEGQGGIIVCNHRSSVDPFFIQTATGRKIHWMVAREYCQHPAFRGFLATCEVIPVGRGGVDTAATKAAIRLAASGEIVGMLPEGRINMSEEFMLPVRPGAALVAMKAGVPVVPCYIQGAPYRRYPWSPLLMSARVEVRFGEPLDPTKFCGPAGEEGGAQQFTLEILKAIAKLAGRSDFEPRIAGRNWKPTAEELDAAMDAKERRDAAEKLAGPNGNRESGVRSQGSGAS